MSPLNARRRTFDDELAAAHRSAGASAVAARVLAGRGVTPEHARPGLDLLTHPGGLPDIESAAQRIAAEIIAGNPIGVETDYDVDGTTAHAIIRESLVRYFGVPEDKVIPYIGHRLNDGYGLSGNLAKRILDEGRTKLVITADNGSSDEERIAQLRSDGIETIVTDHHGIPESGIPKSALGVVSPAREDSQYGDPTIAGCVTAFLLMTQVRSALIAADESRFGNVPRLSSLIDYAACGTIADCVSLASVNNRAIVRHGLSMITAGARPCWQSALNQIVEPGQPLGADFIGFQIGPRINARTRLSEPMAALHYLMSPDMRAASDYFHVLDGENRRRKDVEAEMRDIALPLARDQIAAGRKAAVIFLQDGHSGVNGIVASRVREALGCMTIVLSPSPKDDTMATGSARTGADGPHVLNIMKRAAALAPDMMPHFGGHAGAGGLSVPLDRLDDLSELINQAVCEATDDAKIEPLIETDGVIRGPEITMALVDEFRDLEPWGQKCEYPIFEADARVLMAKPIGDGSHRRLQLEIDGKRFAAVAFGVSRLPGGPLLDTCEKLRVLFKVSDNFWNGTRSLQLMVEGALAPA